MANDMKEISKIELTEKYKILFDNAADLIAVVDTQGIFLDLNKKFEEESGYKKTEMLGKNVFECGIVTESSAEEMMINLAEMLSGREWNIFEVEGVRKDGGIVPYELRAVPFIKDGEIIEVHAILRNITERKQAEDELLKHRDKLEDLVKERTAELEKALDELKWGEEKYRTILENIEDGYYEVDLKGNFTFFNDSMCRMLGYSPEEMMGKNNREYMDEKNSKKVFHTFHTVFTTGQSSKTYDWELVKKNGDICFIETSVTLIKEPSGDPIGFRGVARDVTEKKYSEVALRESEEKYRSILQNIEEGYFEVDLEGNLTFFNDSLCRLVRLSSEELLGMNYKEYTNLEMSGKMYETFTTVYQTGTPANIADYEVNRSDGSTLILALSVSLMKDNEGYPVGFRGIVRDVSRRRQAEKEKQKLEAQLNQIQKMESIGTLAGGIAHDFNNLLMSIQGKISIMLFHMSKDNDNYQKMRDIEGYIKNGADLTKQLLGFARGGKYEVKITNLNDLIDSTTKMFSGTKKEIKIHKNYEQKLMNVDVDQGQINQVLLNLYVNAWQAMPKGGNIFVHTENVLLDEKSALNYQIEPGRYAKISITDTGVGMDRETMKKIFDPVFTTREAGRGTGLGLASAYGIIRNHNGAINVYSEVGKGTTFNIFLPESQKDIDSEDIKHVQNHIVKGTETILFVDDEKRVIESVKEMLAELGYKVILASNGEEAIRIMEDNHQKIDMAIIDMIMPGMDGSELYREMKNITTDFKVLLSSGYSQSSHAENIRELGCDGFIQKPFTLQQLSQSIRSILDRK